MLCGQESSGGSQLHLLVPAKEDVSAWEASQAGGATTSHAEDRWGGEWCALWWMWSRLKPKDVIGRPRKHVDPGLLENTGRETTVEWWKSQWYINGKEQKSLTGLLEISNDYFRISVFHLQACLICFFFFFKYQILQPMKTSEHIRVTKGEKTVTRNANWQAREKKSMTENICIDKRTHLCPKFMFFFPEFTHWNYRTRQA